MINRRFWRNLWLSANYNIYQRQKIDSPTSGITVFRLIPTLVSTVEGENDEAGRRFTATVVWDNLDTGAGDANLRRRTSYR